MSFPPEVKENLFVACHRRCCLCHEYKGSKMEAHHIIPKADGGEDSEENGIPVCFDCHAEVGAYNSKHPKGNKFSSSELRRHKEQWFAICETQLPFLNDSSKKDEEIEHVGIKSFERATENMPQKTLSLTDFFNKNGINDSQSWNNDLFIRLNQFTKEFDPKVEYRIQLETHLSIAFVTGYLLDSKSGIKIYPMQKTRGIKDWSPAKELIKDYPKLCNNIIPSSKKSKEVALVIGITHNILDEVKEYLQTHQIEVSKIINCNVEGNFGNSTIEDGTHAIEIANSISRALKESRDTQEKRNNLHIFASCPGGLMFYLGQLSRLFGNIILYEFDSKNFVYSPSFKLPIESK